MTMSLTQVTTGGVDENINIDSNTLKVDGTNNRVGIGTATPSNILSIAEAGGPTVRFTDSTSGAFGLIENGSNGDFTISADHGNTGASTNIVFKSDGATERMRVGSDGNCSIGTPTNTNKLRVHEGSDSANIILATGADETSEFISLGINSSVPTITAGGVGSTSASLAFRTANNGTESEAMRINASKHLMVGTTTSTYNIGNQSKLGVVITGDLSRGGVDITGYTGGSSTGRGPELNFRRSIGTTDGSVTALSAAPWTLGVINFSGSTGSNFSTGAEIRAVSSSQAYTGSSSGGELRFSTVANNSTSPTERVRIDQAGSIGVGGIAPSKGSFFGGTQNVLHLGGSTCPEIRLQSNASGQGDLCIFASNSAKKSRVYSRATNGAITFDVTDSSGNLIQDVLQVIGSGIARGSASQGFAPSNGSAMFTGYHSGSFRIGFDCFTLPGNAWHTQSLLFFFGSVQGGLTGNTHGMAHIRLTGLSAWGLSSTSVIQGGTINVASANTSSNHIDLDFTFNSGMRGPVSFWVQSPNGIIPEITFTG